MIRLPEAIARRLNKTQEVRHNDYAVREMAEQLLALTDEQFGRYAFLHEPLEGKFDDAQKAVYIRKANACGRETALRELTDIPKGCSTAERLEMLAKRYGVSVGDAGVPTGGGHVLFAQFEEPNRITIFSDCLDRLNTLVEDEKLLDLFEAVDFRSVLLAHELFHAVEHAHKDRIYTQTEKVELWKKPFSNKSRILALSEIAAMSFTKAACQIPFSPYALDVLLLVSYNREAACALYEEILTAAGIPLI